MGRPVSPKIQANQIGHGHALASAKPYENIKGDIEVAVLGPHDTDGSVIINAGNRRQWVDIEIGREAIKGLITELQEALKNWPLT